MSRKIKELLTPILLLALATTVGAWSERLAWALLVALVIWVLIQLPEFRKVDRWTSRPFRTPENGLEPWFQLAYRPYRALQRERARTRAMRDRLREILTLTEVIPDGVIVVNASGEILSLNSAAKTLLNLSDKDIGLGLATVVRNPQFVRYARSGNRLEPLEFSPFLDHEKTYEARRIETEHARAILLVRDVTELNRFLTMRQNFIANVSHELRTPLTVISGYLEAIVDEEKDANLRLELVSRLTAPTDRMKDLVSDLTTLTRLESAPLPDDRAPLDLEQLARAAAAELQPLCTRDDQITVASEGDTRILGIPSELHSICVNLISNALKYSPDGAPINITIKPVGDKVRLTVADQGYGIAPEHLGRLTERFYRVDLRTSRRRGGTGLGLAIVKHALMRHESELQISSTLGEGSTFACDFVRAESLPYA